MDPYQKKQIRQLKKIQNNALRFIFNIRGLTSYSQLRKDAGIESLQERRMSARFSFLLDALEKIFSLLLNTTLKSSIIQDRIQIHIVLLIPYIRANAHCNYFWPGTTRELRQ